MSLAWRILLIVLLLNLVVVGAVMAAGYWAVDRRLRATQTDYANDVHLGLQLASVLQEVYSAERLTGRDRQVKDLIRARSIRGLFADLWVTSGRPPFEGFVHLNVRGAVHRDPDRFPRATIARGLEVVRNWPGLLPVADGYCMAIRSGSEVVGSLWFLPVRRPERPTMPVWPAVLAVVIGTAVFGLLLYQAVRRTVARPLARVGEAAAEVGQGRLEVRVPDLSGMPELQTLVQSFNAMAGRVQGHTEELEQAVRTAVEETKARERALVLSSRLAAIGTLAAGIAHEINNPIGGMLNAATRLLASPDLSERQRTYLELIRDGLQRVARTARKVLDFSPRSIEPQAFALRLAVDAARSLVEHRLQAQQVALRVDVPPDLPDLHGDPHEIQQVLLNLLLNSLDALDGRPGRIDLRARRDGGQVEIEVRDDGPGMAAEDLPRALDPFFSKKTRPDASGLGLFICYSIVENHGGTITVDSAPGQGFRVRIRLPVAPAQG